VSRINVLVATTSKDVRADVIAGAVAGRADMNLLDHDPVLAKDVEAFLRAIPATPQCALVVIGAPAETNKFAEQWLVQRADIVVMEVDLLGDRARIAVRGPRLDPLLTVLRELVERATTEEPQTETHIRLVDITEPEPEPVPEAVDAPPTDEPPERPLLDASVDWVHKLLRNAVENVPDDNGDLNGLSVTKATLLHSLDAPDERRHSDSLIAFLEANAALDPALANADPEVEPLAAAARVFGFNPLEFRMMVLALAPELDLRFQRCIGFLLDEITRRAGSISLYSTLLGLPARVRVALADGGALAQWLVFDGSTGRLPAADEPLRLDPFLGQWLLGDHSALAGEPRVRRALRLVPWPGAALLQRREERYRAEELLEKLNDTRWLLLGGDDPAGWRALIELGARDRQLIRVELPRLAGLDVIEVEDSARRIGRLARLTGEPLVIDATRGEGSEAEDDWLRLFLATLDDTRCRVAVICGDSARIVKLLGSASHELIDEPALPPAARVEAVRTAATEAGVYLTEDAAEAMASRYPLSVDRLEQAMRLALSRPENRDLDDPSLARFTAAAKEVAGEGLSHLAERIEPIFSLDQVVLPPDRKEQLGEIVDHVRLAPRVLDEWKFGDQLPYGRGVTALFHGSSGTGKTMAAMGVARRLGIQLLRLDFSKVVSKYIGDTEKNIDRVFTDAQKSGAAILIDEADALLGKRSEVKDAHDRYANIEVAYLLQRMEAYEGLAILTTNMRQNLDPAFLRRLRFVVDFPRPDAEARQQIWRQCLPEGSHELGDAAFRLLARKIDLTGGHIRQITLRAAFIAAAAGSQINLEHIVHAARAEFAKLGMPPVEIDVSVGRRAA
jgi:SpoVK/Ycf46/Vps4 family AAA+-type ATPase